MNLILKEININGDFIKPQEEVNCDAGDCINVRVNINNSLDRPLRHLILSIQFYQDHQNGIHNYRLEARVAIIGCTK